MITWTLFLPFALAATLLWAMGAIAAISQKRGKTDYQRGNNIHQNR